MLTRRKFLQTGLLATAASLIKPAYSFATDYLSFDYIVTQAHFTEEV